MLVTVSHSLPSELQMPRPDGLLLFRCQYRFPVAAALYERQRTANDWATSGGVTWDAYKDAKAAIVPSITMPISMIMPKPLCAPSR